MTIALIDYGMGNLRNVERAIIAVGGDVRRIEHGDQLHGFDGVILPGVGNFGDGMRHLEERGFIQPIYDAVASGLPFLGICLGMQMLFESSEEAPDVAGLGIFKGKVLRFPEGGAKVPHMGWNTVTRVNLAPLQPAFEKETFFYFVHTYYVRPDDPSVTMAICDYILPFTAAVGRDQVYATQFHPEKSQDAGLEILRLFVKTVKETP